MNRVAVPLVSLLSAAIAGIATPWIVHVIRRAQDVTLSDGLSGTTSDGSGVFLFSVVFVVIWVAASVLCTLPWLFIERWRRK